MGEECCKESCCESGKGSECCSEKCGCEEAMDKGKYMMSLADDAWEELMKEKMKAALQKAKGEKMDRVAQIAVEGCIAYWSNKMKEESAWAEFEEKLKKAME